MKQSQEKACPGRDPGWEPVFRPALRQSKDDKPLQLAALLDADENGLICGYASLFDQIDMAKDTVARGAFRASLAKRGASGVKLLWQHDAKQPIGVWRSIVEDERGLVVRGRLNPAVACARDAYALIRQGAIDGLSIGFKAERARADPRSGARRLLGIDLWEISIVTFPMLPGARVFAVARDASVPDGPSLAETIRRAASLFR